MDSLDCFLNMQPQYKLPDRLDVDKLGWYVGDLIIN